MTTPNPSNVAPWYLRNINQALALDETTGNVYIRTGISGDIIIEGNVNIPGNVDAHISEIGTSGTLTVPYMPIAGNITIDPGQTVEVTQGTNPWAVSGNINVGNQATDITIADSTYFMNIARGLVDSQQLEFKNAWTTGLSSGIESTIWGQNTVYPWASWTVAQKLYIISDNAADTGQVLKIDGLDASFNTITENVTTNGTTAVTTSQNFLRINHVVMQTGAANQGTITTRLNSGAGTVVGYMQVGWARNRQAPYTVPAGYTAYILYGDATQFRGGSGNIGSTVRMYTRVNGDSHPWMIVFAAEVVNGYYRNDFTVPLPVPEKTDIDVRMIPDGNNTTASCNYQMILVPNA